MQKRFYKMASLAVAAVMALSVLPGCGSASKEANPNEKAKGTTGKSSAETSTAPVTIDWLAYQTSGQPDPEADIVKQVEKKFNAKFNFWFVDDQKWDDVLNVKLAAGEMPDVFRIKNTNNIDKYVSMGILAELPEAKIREWAPNYAKTMDKYDTNKLIWNATKYNGKNYGFAMCGLDALYPSVLQWRTDWLKNVGITKIPETLQEFETAMYKFRNEDPDKNGKKDTYGMSNTAMMAVFGAFGVLESGKSFAGADPMYYMLKDGKVAFSCIQPEAKEALTLLQKWYKDGVIDPEFVTGENKGGYWALSHAFMNNKVGVTGQINFYHYSPPNTAEGANGGPCYQEITKVNPQATFEPAKPPVGPGGKSGTEIGGGVGEKFGLTTKCMKDEKKAKIILSILDAEFTDEEFGKLVQWGVKDVDYKVANNNVVLTNSNAADIRKKGIQTFNFMQGNPEIWKKYMSSRYDYADQYAKGLGYIKPSVPPTDAFSKNAETLKKLYQSAYIDIITGAKSIDSFSQFVKDFRAKGGDDTEKAMTEAYNKLMGK